MIVFWIWVGAWGQWTCCCGTGDQHVGISWHRLERVWVAKSCDDGTPRPWLVYASTFPSMHGTNATLVATIHFSPFTCCSAGFLGVHSRVLFAMRAPNSHNHSYVHYSLSKFTEKWFTNHSITFTLQSHEGWPLRTPQVAFLGCTMSGLYPALDYPDLCTFKVFTSFVAILNSLILTATGNHWKAMSSPLCGGR